MSLDARRFYEIYTQNSVLRSPNFL
ncbi:hypothetical protein AGR7B_Cc30040 [Agrobacterium deltaense RV3]|nr:hypothetical protein AGR7B_Cc30040 [Agrobacterium deltaense RV3]